MAQARRLLNMVTASLTLALAACGGGALLVLGFIGSAGGDWVQDDDPLQDGLQVRSTCGPGGNDDCVINIQPVGGQDLFSTTFDLSYTSNLPGCPANGTGRADGRKLELSGCFSGAYVNINQALSSNGTVRMFFDVDENDLQVSQGVWVELQQGTRRFVFRNDGQETIVNGVRIVSNTGCEIGSPNTPLNLGLSMSDIRNPAGPFETTVDTFVIQGGGAAWSGRFVGMSGMRLTRGSEVLELEREEGSATC